MSLDLKKLVMYNNSIYACSVEGIYIECGLRNKNQRTILRDGR